MKAKFKIFCIFIFTIIIFTISVHSNLKELDKENCLNSNKNNEINKCNDNNSQDVFTFSVIRHGARNSKKYNHFLLTLRI